MDFHSIIPSRGTGDGRRDRSLASAHLEGAASELVVRAGHACLEEREVIRETARILAEHVRMSGKDSSPLALDVAERPGRVVGPGSIGPRNDRPGGDAMNAGRVHRVVIVGGGKSMAGAAERWMGKNQLQMKRNPTMTTLQRPGQAAPADGLHQASNSSSTRP